MVLLITNDQCFSNGFINIVHSMPRDIKQKNAGGWDGGEREKQCFREKSYKT